MLHVNLSAHDLLPQMDDSMDSGLVKKCRVCGDKALAFNFNGLSCESCKAFFRRNALRDKELVCLNGDNCDIDVSTRKFCPLCRLRKCFSIGMRKDLVMAREINGSSKNSKPNGRTLPKGKKRPHEASPAVIISESNHLFDFGPYEQVLFDEINRASGVFLLQKPLCALQLNAETNILNQAWSLQESYAKKIIEFCKSIGAFLCLKAHDQMHMVHEFFEESLTIRCAYHYDKGQDGFEVKMNELTDSTLIVRFDVIFPPGKQEHLTTYRNFIQALHLEIGDDKHIRDLLITMCLFKGKKNLSCPEYVCYYYVAYCRLLCRYLEIKFQDREKGRIKYDKLLAFMEEMWNIKELIFKTYSNIDIRLISNILTQIQHLSKS